MNISFFHYCQEGNFISSKRRRVMRVRAPTNKYKIEEFCLNFYIKEVLPWSLYLCSTSTATHLVHNLSSIQTNGQWIAEHGLHRDVRGFCRERTPQTRTPYPSTSTPVYIEQSFPPTPVQCSTQHQHSPTLPQAAQTKQWGIQWSEGRSACGRAWWDRVW